MSSRERRWCRAAAVALVIVLRAATADAAIERPVRSSPSASPIWIDVAHTEGARVAAPLRGATADFAPSTHTPTCEEQDAVLHGTGDRHHVVTATSPRLWFLHRRVVMPVAHDGGYPGGWLIPVISEARNAASASGARDGAHAFAAEER